MIIYGIGYYNRRNVRTYRGRCGACGHYGYQRSYQATRYASLYWIPVIPLGSIRVSRECASCKAALVHKPSEWRKLNHELASFRKRQHDQIPEQTFYLEAMALALEVEAKADFQHFAEEARSRFPQDEEILTTIAIGYHYFRSEKTEQAFSEALDYNKEEDFAQLADRFLKSKSLPAPRPPNRFFQAFPTLLVPGALMLFALLVIIVGLTGKPENVYLVNGLDQPYRVTIGEETFTLHPGRARPFTPPSWSFSVQEGPDAPPFGTTRVDIKASLWEKFNGGPVVVINPDQTSLLFWDRIAYSEREQYEGEYRLYVGQSVAEFASIDFPFREPPEFIQLSQNQRVGYRTALEIMPSGDRIGNFWIIFEELGEAPALAFLARTLALDPHHLSALYFYTSLLEPGESRAFLETRISDDPPLIEWHRIYQNLLQDNWPEFPLSRTYRAKWEVQPDSSVYLYLYGRTYQKYSESDPIFTRATQLNPPSGYAFFALAYSALARADFTRAAEKIAQAIRLEPDNPHFNFLREEIDMARAHYSPILADLRQALDENPTHFQMNQNLIRLLARTGQVDLARQTIEQLFQQYLAEGYTEEDVAESSIWMELTLMEGLQNRAGYLRVAERLSDPLIAWNTAILTEDWDRTLKMLPELAEEEVPGNQIARLLFLYGMAQQRNRPEAEDLWDQALGIMMHGHRPFPALHRILEEGSVDDSETILSLPFQQAGRVIVLFALGSRFPQHRETFFGLAGQLNYPPDFQSMALAPFLRPAEP